ncbi:MAG: LPS-assembly protein LptD, partial [Woeseiaceae bacterium]
MSRYSLSFAGLAFLLALSPARAQQPLVCEVEESHQLEEEAALAGLESRSETFEFEAGHFEGGVGDDPTMTMTGGVLVRRGERLAGAESAIYDPGARSLLLDGGVRYEDPESTISSESAEFAYELGRIRFEGAEFQLGQANSRGAADLLQISEDGSIDLGEVRYTTCPPGSEDWMIEADDIDLATREGTGTARHVKLRFKGVPILYSPYFSFPINDARKSGILTPELGSAGRSGTELRIPWYWNI